MLYKHEIVDISGLKKFILEIKITFASINLYNH